MSEDKQLHIDEGWKSQVDREKEQLRRHTADTEKTDTERLATSAIESQSVDSARASQEEPQLDRDLPSASLTILVSSLATQAMASLGQFPADDGKPMPMNLKLGRHFIDLIGVIEDKTRNNLTSEESSFVSNTLHHLRLLFVECSRR